MTFVKVSQSLTCMSMSPFGCTGKYVTSNPSASKARHESSTHLCSCNKTELVNKIKSNSYYLINFNKFKDRSDDPSHHKQTLLPRSYISLLQKRCQSHSDFIVDGNWVTVLRLPFHTQKIYWKLKQLFVKIAVKGTFNENVDTTYDRLP